MRFTRELADHTEEMRRKAMDLMKREPASYEDLVANYGADNVWTTEQVKELYEITSFMAPYCTCVRKSDGQVGSLAFQHRPRFYFNFVAYQKGDQV